MEEILFFSLLVFLAHDLLKPQTPWAWRADCVHAHKHGLIYMSCLLKDIKMWLERWLSS